MKKILTSLLLVLGLVLLAACTPDNGTDEETDTTKPVIVGADPITITVGDTFDPLEGVTATDDVDGAITLTAANVTGTVNTAEPGTYTLVYKVKDAAGNEAEKSRVVTVVAQAPLGNLIGGDFEREALNGVDGWTTWHDTSQGYDVTYEIEDGELVIDIKGSNEADRQWWGAQVQYNALMLTPFESYTLQFRVKADAERYMNHQIQSGGLPGKAYGEMNVVKVTTEWQTIEVDFYVRGEGVNAQLQFAFGNFTSQGDNPLVPEGFERVLTKVYLDDVKIVAGPELENQAPEINAQNLVIKTGTPTGLKQGISVFDDFTVIQVADVVVVQKTGETPFDPQNPAPGVYTFDVTATDDEGLSTTVTRTITVASPWNRPMTFAITADGGWDITNPEGWYVRQVDQQNSENWLSHKDNEDGSVEITIEKIADGDWRASYRLSNIQFFAGTYTIKFEAKADIARDIRVVIENAGLASEEAFKHIQLTTDWVEITLTYTFETDQMNKGLDFWLGTLTTNRLDPNPYTAEDDILTTVYFRDLTVTYAE